MAIDTRIRSSIATLTIVVLLSFTYLLNVGLLEIDTLPLLKGGTTTAYHLSGAPTSHSQLLQPLVEVQERYPIIKAVISVILIVLGAVNTMSLTIKFNLFGSIIHISSIIYAALMVVLITPSQMIIAPLTGLIMIFALRKIYDSYTSNLSSPKIFSGCFWIGVIPLIYPAMLPIVLSSLTLMIIFELGNRELTLSLWATLTPISIALYVAWLFEFNLGEVIGGYMGALVAPKYNFEGSLMRYIAILFSIGITIFAARKIDDISITLVSRQRILFTTTLIVLTLISPLFPQYAPYNFAAVAAPIAILITTATLEMKTKVATITYLAAILITVLTAVIG